MKRKKSALSSRTLTHFHPVKDLTFAELFEGKKSSQSRISYTKRYLIIYVIMHFISYQIAAEV